MKTNQPFTFEISLSVLNHLGRNLYRSFMTVIGEAISNSWDADANNVNIYLSREHGNMVIKDDGIGMDSDDFQNKFLRIGYSKRKDGKMQSQKERPYIGRKGIGKLALLSCANRISIITKKEGGEYVGGVIDNSGLDEAINDDLTAQQYPLTEVDFGILDGYTKRHKKGTIIYFQDINDGVRNTETYLKKLIALYFRFSLIDKSFNIYFNDELIDLDNLDSLANETQFVWEINKSYDPFVLEKLVNNNSLKNFVRKNTNSAITGFIGTVTKPSALNLE